jgi:hypothetical protein
VIYTITFAGGVTLQAETVSVSVPLDHEDPLMVAVTSGGRSIPGTATVAGPVFLCGEIDVVQLSADLITLKQQA